MTLKEKNLQQAVYGDVPESFQHRVQYALRHTQEEERPVKRFTLRTALITLLLVAIVGAAVAAVASITADRFGEFYGEKYKDALLQGDIDTTLRTRQVGDVIYELDDVIVTGITLDNEEDNRGEDPMSISDEMCSRIYATGTMRAAEGTTAPVACAALDGEGACPREETCTTVAFWAGLDRAIEDYVDNITLADLVSN